MSKEDFIVLIFGTLAAVTSSYLWILYSTYSPIQFGFFATAIGLYIGIMMRFKMNEKKTLYTKTAIILSIMSYISSAIYLYPRWGFDWNDILIICCIIYAAYFVTHIYNGFPNVKMEQNDLDDFLDDKVTVAHKKRNGITNRWSR